ncbi:MAG: hypothetical protein ACR2II_01975, partial [Chthoniobacterales bacterium]
DRASERELSMPGDEVRRPDCAVAPVPLRSLARITFTTVLLTFIAARVLVILIMTRRIPDLFLHVGQTHVHHLNYGIFLLAAVGALFVFFGRPSDDLRKVCAFLYGLGMALTFDEFGMWLHLGGGYWQRASFDAVIVLLSLFGVIAFAPTLARMRPRHWTTAAIMLVAVVGFYGLLFKSVGYVGNRMGPKFQRIEKAGPQ